jgi:predicted transcriptional regulator
MPDSDKVSAEELLRMTTDIAAAYVSNNAIASPQLPEVIKTIHSSLLALQGAAGGPEGLTPAVPIKKSITPDFIICLEDGKKLKMLKRHLRTAYDMTPEEYQAGSAADYPMVAPNYAGIRLLPRRSVWADLGARRRADGDKQLSRLPRFAGFVCGNGSRLRSQAIKGKPGTARRGLYSQASDSYMPPFGTCRPEHVQT